MSNETKYFWTRGVPLACIAGAIVGLFGGLLNHVDEIGDPYVIVAYCIVAAPIIIGALLVLILFARRS